MNKHQKVAVIVWTIDPEGIKRFLLRHNKPFNGYDDEWTVIFGDIEVGESLEDAAKREASEEFRISNFEQINDLNYTTEFEGKHGLTEVHFVALKVLDINTQIVLNEESIGYDWMLIDQVKRVMKNDNEKQAFDLIK